ncbi:hypothetical protein QW71_33230 [Paenibacillus sp. IHB B 3415]|uniref:hypothetical protein n=1 Tax=Paenibacillus sp. IHB B 3415 TaxID=867080 RepID=UPI000575C848|nr:hypothetical protein [Paenibacillus sp. IHB B 3415]KHL91706.1 hypothetical protein QW71_33230 [Paenibacillus sp. IHB B 3415]
MTRFGKKLVMVGIWAGVGLLVGLQFGGGSGSGVSGVLPGWNTMAGNTSSAGGQLQAGQSSAAGAASLPAAGTTQGGQAYVYVPVVIDPATGAYKVLPVQQPVAAGTDTAAGTGSLPQQEVKDYTTLSPEQILIPGEQKPTVDVLADKTAGLLQQASQKSIRWVVSLFDSSEE